MSLTFKLFADVVRFVEAMQPAGSNVSFNSIAINKSRNDEGWTVNLS